MIGIVDYNMGNLASVINAFDKSGAEISIESNPDKLIDYEKIILPGVGAFGDAMEHLQHRGMDEAIKNYASSGKPLMGICLGMQLLFDSSEEFGEHKGLGLIPGEVVAFDQTRFDKPHKVPHMGWNELFQADVDKARPKSRLFDGLPDEFYLYFVHSYHAKCEDRYTIGKSYYGYEFVSAVQNENIYGIQPHPEKSHSSGLKIVENFTKL